MRKSLLQNLYHKKICFAKPCNLSLYISWTRADGEGLHTKLTGGLYLWFILKFIVDLCNLVHRRSPPALFHEINNNRPSLDYTFKWLIPNALKWSKIYLAYLQTFPIVKRCLTAQQAPEQLTNDYTTFQMQFHCSTFSMQFMEITVFEVWLGWALIRTLSTHGMGFGCPRPGIGCPGTKLTLTIGKQANHQTCLMAALPT